MPTAIYPTQDDEREDGDLEIDRDRKEMYNPNFGLTKSITARIGDKGFSEKLTYIMAIQFLLAIYYVVGYFLELQHFHNYYKSSPEEDANEASQWLSFRTDVDSFECEGYQLYRIDKGPTPHRYQTDSTMRGEGAWKISVAFWIFMVFSFCLFIFTRLYRGHYNQLIGFVTFESKHHSPPKIIKFGLAFTVICNFSKGAGSLFLTETCDLMSYAVFSMNETMTNRDWVTFYAYCVYFGSFGIMCLWAVCWGYNYICKDQTDIESGTFSFWMVRMSVFPFFVALFLRATSNLHSTCTRDFDMPKCAVNVPCASLAGNRLSKNLMCHLFITYPFKLKNNNSCNFQVRFFTVVTIASYYFIGAMNFNPKINFDFQYPNWAVLSGLSFADLVFSTIADLYFNRPGARFFRWLLNKCRTTDDSESHESSTCSSSQDSTTAATTTTFTTSSGTPESPSGPSSNGDTPENRLEEGHQMLEPGAAAAEQYVNYQAHCGENEGKAYEKKIKDDVSMAVRANHVNLAENPYYIQGKRNDGALQELSAMLAECPDDEKEVLLVLRALQRNAIGLSDAQSKEEKQGICSSTE